MLKCLFFGALVFFASYSQAQNLLMTDLDGLNRETLRAEFLALNCLMEAQESKLITKDCRNAERMVVGIDQELVFLVNYLMKDGMSLGKEFTIVMSKIKDFRTRLDKVNDNLERAKKITGIYNWTNDIAPSYYEYIK